LPHFPILISQFLLQQPLIEASNSQQLLPIFIFLQVIQLPIVSLPSLLLKLSSLVQLIKLKQQQSLAIDELFLIQLWLLQLDFSL